ncbi:2TM domain-containing protein [Jatrophihabitans fulvus]
MALDSSSIGPTPQDEEARARARLKKKRDLGAHVLIYVLVNSFLTVVWAVTGDGFFWPMFPIFGWGIGLVMNAWDVWRGDDFTPEEIAREIERQRRATQSQGR